MATAVREEKPTLPQDREIVEAESGITQRPRLRRNHCESLASVANALAGLPRALLLRRRSQWHSKTHRSLAALTPVRTLGRVDKLNNEG